MRHIRACFPPDGHSLIRFDGTSLYEYEDAGQHDGPDARLLHFNFGRREVANYLIANCLFWLEKYHIDGIRIDNVSSIIYRRSTDDRGTPHGGEEDIEAIEFIKHLNSIVHQYYPDTAVIADAMHFPLEDDPERDDEDQRS